MQDAGRAQLRQLAQLETQRARREVQAPRHLHEVCEGGALQRNGEAPPQPREVDAVAVEARDHAQAREAALGRLGLQEDRQALRGAQLEARQQLHQVLPARLRSGSKIHSMRRRRSSRMSASSCMPGCNGSSRP